MVDDNTTPTPDSTDAVKPTPKKPAPAKKPMPPKKAAPAKRPAPPKPAASAAPLPAKPAPARPAPAAPLPERQAAPARPAPARPTPGVAAGSTAPGEDHTDPVYDEGLAYDEPEPLIVDDAEDEDEGKRSWLGRRKKKAKKQATTADDANDDVNELDEDGHEALNRIPAPGKPYRNTKRVSTTTRSVVIGATALALLGSCGVGAFGAVSMTRTAANRHAMTAADAEKAFHLDQFPTQQAATFAGRYLSLCLSRYPAGKNETMSPDEQKRQDAVEAMSVAANDTSCVPGESTTGGEGMDRTVVNTTFTGQTSPVNGMKNARYVTMQVTTSDGVVSNYSVPVWFQNPDNAQGPRVVGSIGAVPLTRMGGGANLPQRTEDTNLAGSLQSSFMPQLMDAWFTSGNNLPQFLAPNASSQASTGLQGLYQDVKVQKVQVYPDKADQPTKAGESITYHEGSTVEADVTVSATSAASKVKAEQSYRVTLVRQNNKWFVQDIQAGTVSGVTPDRGGKATQPGIKSKPTPSPSSSSSKPSSSSSKPSSKPSSSSSKK